MAIDKSLRQEYEDQDYGLNKALKYVSADRDNGNWRDKKNLPINVFPFPFKKSFKDELEEMEKEKEKLEKDKKTGIKTLKRLASHNSEALAMEYWFDRWQEHELRDQFKTLKSFISWSLAHEDQPFHRGGLASLII